MNSWLNQRLPQRRSVNRCCPGTRQRIVLYALASLCLVLLAASAARAQLPARYQVTKLNADFIPLAFNDNGQIAGFRNLALQGPEDARIKNFFYDPASGLTEIGLPAPDIYVQQYYSCMPITFSAANPYDSAYVFRAGTDYMDGAGNVYLRCLGSMSSFLSQYLQSSCGLSGPESRPILTRHVWNRVSGFSRRGGVYDGYWSYESCAGPMTLPSQADFVSISGNVGGYAWVSGIPYGSIAGVLDDSQMLAPALFHLMVPGYDCTRFKATSSLGHLVGLAAPGCSYSAGYGQTFIVRDGEITTPSSLQNTFPRAINDLDQVVGLFAYEGPSDHAFIIKNNTLTDIHSKMAPSFYYGNSEALDINNSGVATAQYIHSTYNSVRSQAFVVDVNRERAIPLKKLIMSEPASELVKVDLKNCFGCVDMSADRLHSKPINNAGVVLTHGWDAANQPAVFILTPQGTWPENDTPGDLNCDGAVNFDDIDPFTLALGNRPGYEAQYPNCNWRLADMNGDFLVNFNDVDLFVAALGGAGGKKHK